MQIHSCVKPKEKKPQREGENFTIIQENYNSALSYLMNLGFSGVN